MPTQRSDDSEPRDEDTAQLDFSFGQLETLNDIQWLQELHIGEDTAAWIETLGPDSFVDMVMRLDELGFGQFIFNSGEINSQTLTGNPVDPHYREVANFFSDPANQVRIDEALRLYPGLQSILDEYRVYVLAERADVAADLVDNSGLLEDQLMEAFGEGFTWAGDFLNTHDRLQRQFNWEFRRASTYPDPSLPWEMRIGAGRFSVPPISINVSQNFSVGSLTGGAIRQQQSPKFNSGHKETMISLTLYFPTHESIWGLGSDPEQEIDFATAEDAVIDRYLSSLRGLITQFKYAPFLPVRNHYLNSAWGITGVTLQGMSIATVADFPFCLAVNLQMLKFNHQVYLPMIEDFHESIHWGKYRQFMGRAAEKLNSVTNEGFLIEKPGPVTEHNGITGWLEQFVDRPADHAEITYEGKPTNNFNSPYKNYLDGNLDAGLSLYYPTKTPLQVFSPDTSSFRTKAEEMSPLREEAGWATFLGRLGLEVSEDGQSDLDSVRNYAQSISLRPSQRELLLSYLQITGNAAEVMTADKLEGYIQAAKDQALKDPKYHGTLPANVEADIEIEARGYWFYYIFSTYRETPFFRSYLEQAEFSQGQFLIQEWDVPMSKFTLDKEVVINGISVSLSNNFSRLQVQMQNEPVHQHIGGGDTRLDISLTIHGDEELARLQNLFEHISNLAQLEHAHGVLGFLGVKNIITAVAGIKYVLPLSFEVDTIPGFPGVFNCRLSFVDFDVFQQKREILSSEQQQELVDAFGKRNPFLRVKQLWGAFNAYPDFPLSIRDKEGKVLGTIDPDFYFKSYQMIEDDITIWDLPNVDAKYERKQLGSATLENTLDENGVPIEDPDIPAASGAEGSSSPADNPPTGYSIKQYAKNTNGRRLYDHAMHYYMGLYGEDEDNIPVIEMTSQGMSLGSVTKDGGSYSYLPNAPFFLGEDTAERAHTNPHVPGLTALADHQRPMADGSQVPFKQYELMMQDTQYRDVSGRMIRAFPTYMMWLIDEGGRFAGVKLFDNFYGLQSIIDFAVHSSEDVLGDTLVFHVSNLYQKLTTSYKDMITSEGDNLDGSGEYTENQSIANVIETPLNRARNLLSGLDDDYVVNIGSIRLKPGVRVHLRAGYGANPNALQTIFNGVITVVTAGDIVEVTAQSDAIELSPYVNTTDKKGHTGTLPGVGGINTGLWLSEPRDLMVRLLCMGSSSFKESFAHATNGMIFSENRFGIRHFGQMLYAPLTDAEEERQGRRYQVVKQYADTVINDNSIGDVVTSGASAFDGGTQDQNTTNLNPVVAGIGDAGIEAYDSAYGVLMRSPVSNAVQNMWTNFFRQRDYEIFKRNIYPGNGLGVAQFLGGDLLDGGVTVAASAGSEVGVTASNPLGFNDELQETVNAINDLEVVNNGLSDITGDTFDPLSIQPEEDQDDDGGILNAVQDVWSSSLNPLAAFGVGGYLGGLLTDGDTHPILEAMGLTATDSDLPGFDEVSFRAQTYMKSVWDLFQLCAALLPNYIVAVRPFVDRSTVFYGKPHWLYTSDLIPLTTGVPKSEGPEIEQPDALLAALQKEVLEGSDPLADLESQLGLFDSLTKAGSNVNPYSVTRGEEGVFSTQDVSNMLLINLNGAVIQPRSGKVEVGPHIEASGENRIGGRNSGTEVDPTVHIAAAFLDREHRWPEFRAGRPGFWGQLDKVEEQYYIAMDWPLDGENVTRSLYRDGTRSSHRILVVNERTNKAVVCVPGDKIDVAAGDKDDPNVLQAKISPEAAFAIDLEDDDVCHFGWMPDGTTLGAYVGGGSLPTTETALQLGAEFTAPPAEGSVTNLDFIPADFLADNPTYATDPIRYAYDYGWRNKDVPVFIDPDGSAGSVSGTFVDRVGDLARRMYDQDYNLGLQNVGDGIGDLQDAALAEAIAGLAGTTTGAGGDANSAAYAAFFPGNRSRGSDWAEIIWDTFRDKWPDEYDWVKLDFEEKFGAGSAEDLTPETTAAQERPVGLSDYTDSFIKVMWQSEIGRAWIVLTADRSSDNSPGINLGDEDEGVSLGDDVDFNFGPPGDDNAQPLRKAWRFFIDGDFGVDVINETSGTELTDNAIRAREEFFRIILSPDVYEEGADDSNVFSGIEQAAEDLWDGTVGKIISASAQALSGLVALYRMNMMQLGEGLDMLGAMQKQANILNKIFNDSIYYAAGSPGTLSRLADNPFTREYGEPVVEVREPFQRMHFLSSFQHIVDNKISENLNNVATVVTASSDGKYPVTVYFDRGAPSERQIEKAVETGLFWDNVRGGGFFGFLHPILHPIETGRGIAKAATGSSDTILSKRVGLYHLKESLKDIYTGEVIILGDADIRPHDLVYLSDLYERMYGMFEVEQVVHNFDPETGFTTRITPNAIVTINDPARWSVISWAWSWWGVKNTRDDVRQILNIKADRSSQISSAGVTTEELSQALEVPTRGQLQYTQGNSAVIRDVAATMSSGLTYSSQQRVEETQSAADNAFGIVGFTAPILAGALWPAWEWVRDNLLDQHGCYIQYLNKDGQAMDAGLSYNQGVAVGTHHSTNLLPGILGVDVDTLDQNGYARITTNDLLSQLGWQEVDIQSLERQQSWWVDQTHAQILEASGNSPDAGIDLVGLGMNALIKVVTIVEAIDGDTVVTSEGEHIRLTGIDTEELRAKHNLAFNSGTELAEQARRFLQSRLIDEPSQNGYDSRVVVRINTLENGGKDPYDRTLGVIFHNAPSGLDADARVTALAEIASRKQPFVAWDSYLPDGRAYTLNWELIMAGLARVGLYEVSRNDPDRGALGINDNGAF